MRVWNLFKNNKALRNAKSCVDEVQQLNNHYEALTTEQNQLLVDAQILIKDQGDIIRTQKQTIQELRKNLAFEKTSKQPPVANQPSNPFN